MRDLNHLFKKVEKIEKMVYNMLYYRRHLGKMRARCCKAATKRDEMAKRAIKSIQVFKKIMEVSNLPKKVKTCSGKKYIIRLNLKQYYSLMNLLNSDKRKKERRMRHG